MDILKNTFSKFKIAIFLAVIVLVSSFLLITFPFKAQAAPDLKPIKNAWIFGYDGGGYSMTWSWEINELLPGAYPYEYDVMVYYRQKQYGSYINFGEDTTSNTSASFGLNLQSCGCQYVEYEINIIARYNVDGDIYTRTYNKDGISSPCPSSCSHSSFTGVNVSAISSTSLKISWSGVNDHNGPAPITARATLYNEDGIYIRYTDVSAGAGEASFDNLTPSTYYQLSVTPWHSDHYPGNDMWLYGDESTKLGISTSPSAQSCGDNIYGLEMDYSQALCGAAPWSLTGGNSWSVCWRDTMCCGDDSNEFYRTCQQGSGLDYSVCIGTTKACCVYNTNCVNNGSCFSSGGTSGGSSPNGHDNTYICDGQMGIGFWYDCDYSALGSPKAYAGEGEVGEYDENLGSVGAWQCCADDNNEYLKTNVQTGVTRCCSSNSDVVDA